MARVLCTRPNAAEEISGVKFEQVEGGMLSEEIDQETVDMFLEVGGYEVHAGEDDGKSADSDTNGDGYVSKAELIEKAEALGIKVAKSWTMEKIAEAIAAAQPADDADSDTNGDGSPV